MKLAQDYLKETVSGETRGGFNARLQGQTFSQCMDGMPAGHRWGQRNAGWELAENMINRGEIFSEIVTDNGRVEFKCFLDGDSFCCIAPEFINLQESDCYAFGDTRQQAIDKFLMLPARTTND